MKFTLVPEYKFKKFNDVTAEFLVSLGIKGVLLDIDNTLAPYEQDDPDERILTWFEALHAAGIQAALISNNHPPRVERFNAPLGLPAYADSGKPGSRTILAAMRDMGVEASETAGLGDQLLTDTLAVHRLGMISLIVPPIKDKTTLFFRFKRWLERPFIKRYRKIHESKEAL